MITKHPSLLLSVLAALAVAQSAQSATPDVRTSAAGTTLKADTRYTADGKLVFPTHYREWIYLSSGLDMSYSQDVGRGGHSMFDNVFVTPDAYRTFLSTGTWPDGTMLVLESRGAAQKGSINRHGRFQTKEVMGVEVHVKDTKRFAGGWAFFAFRGRDPAPVIPARANCYTCHREHGAVDTTFVQFYPTLIEVAASKGTLAAAK